MKRLLLILTLFITMPSLALASTFWRETFENHLWAGSNTNPWDTDACTYLYGQPGNRWPDGCNAYISQEWAHSGTHSLKGDYREAVWPTHQPDNNHGTYYNREFQESTDVWVSFWFRHTGFTPPPGGQPSKVLYVKTNGGTLVGPGCGNPPVYSLSCFEPMAGVMFFYDGMDEIGWFVVGGQGFQYCEHSNNVIFGCNYLPGDPSQSGYPRVHLQNGGTYCVEGHLSKGAGTNNGVVEIFINGQQTLGFYNQPFGEPSGHGMNLIRHFTQIGTGERWLDDIAVGDTRQGCSDVGPGDTIPPAIPSGVAIR